MRRAIAASPAGSRPAADEVGTVTLAYDERTRRRVRLEDDSGTPFLLDLPRAVALADGDALVLEGGAHLRVVAAQEDLAEVRATSGAGLARIAWHLGNRHLPVVIGADAVRVRWDPVIVAMLRGLGAVVVAARGPFEPEAGAYAAGVHGVEGGHAHVQDGGAG